jgi:signal transduction histidine kinase
MPRTKQTISKSARPVSGLIAPSPLEKLFELSFESLPLALAVFDANLNIVISNRMGRELMGHHVSIPQALCDIAVESSYEDWERELRAVAELGRTRVLDVTRKDPETYFQVGLHPLRLNGPRTGGFVGGLFCAEDVSSRISIERRLAVSERLAAVGKLSAKIAHELNNPLDGILRYINLAIRRVSELCDAPGMATDGDLQRYLDQTRIGIMRMGEIITSLLDFSRTTPLAMEQASINKIAEDAVTAMQGHAIDSRVSVVCNFHQTDMPVVRGSSIFQVFCNLIKNAIDAMPDGGTLTITTKIAGPDCVIRLEDTGSGLPADIEKIFEPFYTTKPPGKGTGLGLAVCRELIEKYSGSITAHRRESRGSAFVVRIPMRNLESNLNQGTTRAARKKLRRGS